MKKILLVEDNDELRYLIKQELEDRIKNVVITEAKSGNEGFFLYESSGGFDGIVSDYSMSDGNGLDLLKKIQAKNAEVFFIIFSSHLDLKISTPYPRFLGVVQKFKMEELVSKILTFL